MNTLSSLILATLVGVSSPEPLDFREARERNLDVDDQADSESLALAGMWLEAQSVVQELGISGEVSGRIKTPWSLAAKAQRKGIRPEEVLDRLAVRVLVPDVTDCYAVQSALHQRFEVVPGSVDDYIAAPKGNGYASLHSALHGAHGQIVEVQVRTPEMHAWAEKGGASHAAYKAEQGFAVG